MKDQEKIDELIQVIQFEHTSNARRKLMKKELRGFLESKLSKGKTVGIYWSGSHGLYSMMEDGKIESDITLGGRTIATPKYKSAYSWFNYTVARDFDLIYKIKLF